MGMDKETYARLNDLMVEFSESLKADVTDKIKEAMEEIDKADVVRETIDDLDGDFAMTVNASACLAASSAAFDILAQYVVNRFADKDAEQEMRTLSALFAVEMANKVLSDTLEKIKHNAEAAIKDAVRAYINGDKPMEDGRDLLDKLLSGRKH